MAGKSIYFSEDELWWILWSMQNQDAFEGNEKFEKANQTIAKKVQKALDDVSN
ncbi:hypothetical protein [Gorillibacterium sp. sgz5001074]|uniref:hypothetical protein n=1 Tax=Gorillibacterium sp. sgz5001074 TaxID=3446695 RepID=UPI003F677AB5